MNIISTHAPVTAIVYNNCMTLSELLSEVQNIILDACNRITTIRLMNTGSFREVSDLFLLIVAFFD